MSFGDQPLLTGWQKVGCAVYFIIAGFIVLHFTIEGLAPSSDAPTPPQWLLLLYFPGSAIIATLLGGLLLHVFTREKK